MRPMLPVAVGSRSQSRPRHGVEGAAAPARLTRTGVDPAITGEPPEERAREGLTRTGRVGPSEPWTRAVVCRPGTFGRTAASEVVPRCRPDQPGDVVLVRNPAASRQLSTRWRDAAMTYPKVDFLAPEPDDGTARPQGVAASPRFPEIEERILRYWAEDGTFQASVENRPAGEDGDNEFVFYDGPPFANGLPHYGHLLTGYVKDLIPRYQTMRGRRVERRFGWDTHGLPAELEAMAQLGIKTKEEIDELGIAKFNDACRQSVLRYTQEWRDYVTRQARWVDFENDYKTLDLTYMESVMWAFKQLHSNGLAYEGFRCLPYCWNDETPLSAHELRMDDDVYQLRKDPAVTVGLRLETGELALVWTTTPWTLPSNLAMAVHRDVDYVVVESDVTGRPERYLLAEARLP